MKKVVYTKVGGLESIEIVEKKRDNIGDGEVRVRVHSAGINFADLMMRQGLYGASPNFPFTPGYEVSGEVTEIGKNVTNIDIKDRVIAIPGIGGYSEEIVVSENRVVSIPDEMSYEQAAAIPVTYGTAYHMLVHLGGIKAGDSVLIHHAAGGVGTAAAQICKTYGASVIIGTASGEKRDFVESLGMLFVDKNQDDFVKICKEVTGGKGVHQAIDPVAGKHLMRSYKALRNGGKLHCFGASSAIPKVKKSWLAALRMWINTPKFNPIKMMKSNKSIFGVHMGTLDDERLFKNHLRILNEMMILKKIEPVIDSVWRFENVSDAQKHMHDRKNCGKIILDFSPRLKIS
jgi:NADPH:quinone reductase-like Zn-dependent oxidoreductase